MLTIKTPSGENIRIPKSYFDSSQTVRNLLDDCESDGIVDLSGQDEGS